MAPEQTCFSSQICARLPKIDFIFLLTSEKRRRRSEIKHKTQPPPSHFTEEPLFVSLNSQKCLCCRGRFLHILLNTGSENVLFSIPGGWRGSVLECGLRALINLPKRRWRWKPWRAFVQREPRAACTTRGAAASAFVFLKSGRKESRASCLGEQTRRRSRYSSLARSFWLTRLTPGRCATSPSRLEGVGGGGVVVILPAGEKHNTFFFSFFCFWQGI